MTTNEEKETEIPVIRPNGPLDRRVAALVRFMLKGLAARGMPMAAVDLSEAGEADEHGVELLAELSRRAIGEGWRWLVVSLSDVHAAAFGHSFRLHEGRAFALIKINSNR